MKISEEVKKRFNEKYKLGNTPWSRGVIAEPIRQFRNKVKNEYREPRLLDLGCGDGWLSIYFAKSGFKVEGIDSSKVAIKIAKQKSKRHGLNVSFRTGDALDFPYPKNSFDIVFDRGLFHHQPKTEWRRYIKGVRKVLKDNGYFYLIAFSDRSLAPHKKSKSLWQRMKDETGYWTYNHYFNSNIIEKIFGKHFKIVSEDEDTKPQPGGSVVQYFTLKKP